MKRMDRYECIYHLSFVFSEIIDSLDFVLYRKSFHFLIFNINSSFEDVNYPC